MTDESDPLLNALEADLRRIAPAPLPESLCQRIGAALEDEPLTFSDRVLAGFSTLGALAACMIAAVTIWQAMAPAAPQVTPADLAAQQRLNIAYQQLLAAR